MLVRFFTFVVIGVAYYLMDEVEYLFGINPGYSNILPVAIIVLSLVILLLYAYFKKKVLRFDFWGVSLSLIITYLAYLSLSPLDSSDSSNYTVYALALGGLLILVGLGIVPSHNE